MVEDESFELSDETWARLLKGYDDPWELEAPADFDFFKAKARFLVLAQVVTAVVGAADVEVWPMLRGTTFHGLVQLPAEAVGGENAASLRASNFGNLVTLYPLDEVVLPDVRAQVRTACEKYAYRYVPSRVLRGRYTGYHLGKAAFDRWGQRFFDYI